jgi:hypothetical protein
MAGLDEAQSYGRAGSTFEEPSPASAVAESPRRACEVLRSLALDRFPTQRRTLSIFFGEIQRALDDAAAGSGDELEELLMRLEDFLDALLMGEDSASLR